MSFMKKALQFLFSVYCMIIFLTLMFLLAPFIFFAFIFNEKTRVNLIYKIVTLWADLAMVCWGMWHKNYYDFPHDNNRPVIFVFNHISYLDIPILLKSFRMQPIRVLGKAEINSIPIFGHIYKSVTITVNRSDRKDRALSLVRLKNALLDNISIVLAPEGTFNMTNKPLKDFYDGAFRLAIETQTPIKPVIFLDAFDRLNYRSIFSFAPGKSRSFFLSEIKVDGYTMEDIAGLKQKVYSVMENALTEKKASWIKT
jgi:1-acyl-sn-glycerol-3-phosphate acyltransferase